MKHGITILLFLTISLIGVVSADYLVSDSGDWPADWPKELEPFRKQSRTLEGPLLPQLHYAIPFEKREEFEAAWPHIVSVKTKNAPIVLRRGSNFFLGKGRIAGVCIHTPPEGQAPQSDILQVQGNWERTTYIELVVDGSIVDLNRIELPADTPIIDERFKETLK